MKMMIFGLFYIAKKTRILQNKLQKKIPLIIIIGNIFNL